MKLAYKIAMQVVYERSFIDVEDLSYCLIKYRGKILKSNIYKFTYKKYPKNTPEKVKAILCSFNRKIDNKELFYSEKITKQDYFEGIEYIYNIYYNSIDNEQKLSAKEKYNAYVSKIEAKHYTDAHIIVGGKRKNSIELYCRNRNWELDAKKETMPYNEWCKKMNQFKPYPYL